MSLLTLFAQIPTAVWIGLICSIAIPYISAFLTDHPSELTGQITTALAGLNGVLSTLAASGHVTWKAAGAGLLSWLVASVTHSKWVAGARETKLHTTGAHLGKAA